MDKKPFIYQKLELLFNKHSIDGNTPKSVIEANMAREFRICREDIHKILVEMDLEKETMKKRRSKWRADYTQQSYSNELKSFR